MSADEVVGLVDRDGTVIGSELRSVVRKDNLLHAGTGVLLRHPDGRIYVHRRSDVKDWAPGHHDAAAGGVILDGEQPADSASRELAEELGVHGVELRPLGSWLYEDDTTRCFEHVYEATSVGPIVHQASEVVWGAWMTLGELGGHLADPRWLFVPDTRALLERLASGGVSDYPTLRDGRSA